MSSHHTTVSDHTTRHTSSCVRETYLPLRPPYYGNESWNQGRKQMRWLTARVAQRLALAFGGATILVACLALAPGGAPAAYAQPASAVSIIDFAFQPASITVPVGGRVTWTNNGMAPHTTTSQAGGWDSGRLTSGQSFSMTFSRAGSFSYICTIHPNMMGTVVVQAAPAAAAPAAAPPAAAQPAPAAVPAQRPAAAPVAAAPQAQRPAAPAAVPAQRPAAAPAAAPAAPRPAAAAPAAPRPAAAAAPVAQRPAATTAAALPRSGVGGTLNADNGTMTPTLAAAAALALGLTGLFYRRRRA
jgi:plastocyanin